MSKVIQQNILTTNITMTECSDGWWLYDFTRGMNLAMRAKTSESALVDALTYYQNRLQKVEQDLKSITSKVEQFVNQFTEVDDN